MPGSSAPLTNKKEGNRLIIFARIMTWFTGLMFFATIGFEIWAFAHESPLITQVTFAILIFTFAVQHSTWRMNVKTELARKERSLALSARSSFYPYQ